MAKRVSATTVGAFIVSSIALVVAAVLVLGSGKFLHPRHEFVCFFGGNLNGLKPGAPVKFRGVQIGSVTAVRLRIPGQKRLIDTDPRKAALPVIIELDQSQITSLGGAGIGNSKIIDAFIARGLRAQLATESLLTGLLYIDLNFHEDAPPPRYILEGNSNYREIPTIPTTFEQIQEKALSALAKLDQIDFGALINALTQAASATRDFVGSPQLRDAIIQLKETAASMKTAVDTITRTTDALTNHIDPVMTSLKKTSDQAALTLTSAQTALNNLSGTFDPASPIGYQIFVTLQNVSDASKSVSNLADYLSRNPSALVRGKASEVVKTP
jgi:paraquat-inducible protein B